MESETVEYKREYTDDIRKTVVAFANTKGGEIHIGIEDDGKIVGLVNAHEDILKVTNLLRDTIKPDVTLMTKVEIQVVNDRQVIIIAVSEGLSKPYYLSSKGIRPEGVFIRRGSSTFSASESLILSMIKETAGDSFEDAVSMFQDLSFEGVEAYFNRKGIELGPTQKRSLGLISENGVMTQLGLLMSDQCVHTIKCAVFEGSQKTVFKDRKEITGSLLDQLEEVYSYIDRYNRTRSEYRGLERIDRKDYPNEAIREALLNALVHRDYGYRASTLISIFDDRIEFVSVGGLLRGFSLSDVLLGVSVLRNPKLANIFYRLHLIEAYGTGLMKIQNTYRDARVKPMIETSDHAFKVTLPNINARYEIDSDFSNLELREEYYDRSNFYEQKVIQMLRKNRSVTRKDIQEAIGISQASTINLIRVMLTKTILIKQGNGRNSKYQLNVNKSRIE